MVVDLVDLYSLYLVDVLFKLEGFVLYVEYYFDVYRWIEFVVEVKGKLWVLDLKW